MLFGHGWSRYFGKALPESVSVRVNTLTDDIRKNQPLENKLKDIVLFFAIVSIILTLLGVYSSITLDTERRQKEVAIRKVNGAGVSQIILLFARLYIILLTGSAVLAFPLLYLVLIQWKRMYTVFLITASFLGRYLHVCGCSYDPDRYLPYLTDCPAESGRSDKERMK